MSNTQGTRKSGPLAACNPASRKRKRVPRRGGSTPGTLVTLRSSRLSRTRVLAVWWCRCLKTPAYASWPSRVRARRWENEHCTINLAGVLARKPKAACASVEADLRRLLCSLPRDTRPRWERLGGGDPGASASLEQGSHPCPPFTPRLAAATPCFSVDVLKVAARGELCKKHGSTMTMLSSIHHL